MSRNATCRTTPQKPDWGTRVLPMTGELWIEREDFMEVPKKGYFRLFPGNTVRLKYGFVIKCTGFSKGADGRVDAVHCEYLPETKSGTAGAEAVKVKGVIHWLSAAHAFEREVRAVRSIVQGAAARCGNTHVPG